MEKKDIRCKFTYKCGICGKEHSSVYDRMNCEMACVKKQQEEERKVAEAKKKEEQMLRKKVVDEAFENLHRLVTDYVKDYGHYEYADGGEDTNFYWPSRLWNHFWD